MDNFETERTRAERLQPIHFNELCIMHNDPKVMETLEGIRTQEQTREWLEKNLRQWQEHGYGIWIFREKTSSAFLGRAGLRNLMIENRDEIELAFALMSPYWGMGLGTEIALALVNVAKGIGLTSLVSFTYKTNTASKRVMEKAGFVYDRDIIYKNKPCVLSRKLL